MSQFFVIHSENPQKRLIAQAAKVLSDGGVIVYPTDSCYALGCHIGDKAAMDRFRSIRRLDHKHDFTLMCRDLSDIANYARVDNRIYRLLKTLTPGPYTFLLKATREVPRRLQHPKRKTIGLRVPDNSIALALLEALNEPILTTSLILPGDPMPFTDPYEIREILDDQVDLVIDGGYCGYTQTTIVDLSEGQPLVIREGKGDVTLFSG